MRWAEQDEPIESFIILALKDLVESMDPVGLIQIQYQNDAKIDIIEKKFRAFHNNIYLKLSNAARQRLNEQRIILNDINSSFKETYFGAFQLLMDETEQIDRKGGTQCSASALHRFACLIMDYAPYLHFGPVIEGGKKSHIDEMRAASRHKSFRDAEQIKEQALVLFFSLLTTKFQIFFESSETIAYEDYENTIPRIVKPVFDAFLPLFTSDNFTDAIEIYVTAMDELIKPAALDASFITTLCRSKVTKNWLQSVVDGEVFKSTKLYTPESLFEVLMAVSRKKTSKGTSIQNCLDQFMSMCVNSDSPHVIKLNLNLRFTQLLNTFDKHTQTEILNKLNAANKHQSPVNLNQQCLKYVLFRLNLLDPVVPKSKMNFFPKTLSQDLKDATNVADTVEKLIGVVKAKPRGDTRNKMLSYLHEIKCPGLETDAVNRHSSLHV